MDFGVDIAINIGIFNTSSKNGSITSIVNILTHVDRIFDSQFRGQPFNAAMFVESVKLPTEW
jgi:hypothetical protein